MTTADMYKSKPENIKSDDSTHCSSLDDWRLCMFGNYILDNSNSVKVPETPATDEENPVQEQLQDTLVPTEEAFDQTKYDYIAVFIGADYCPHCKAFAPTVKASVQALEAKRCKVVFVSNDRNEDAFHASRNKNVGIVTMPYKLTKTQAMRDMFNLKTIPALMVLKNDNFDQKRPTVVTNARDVLPKDPDCNLFPWIQDSHKEQMSAYDRLIVNGKYGNWYDIGHHSNPAKPDQMYMDEHAVRIRAGLLNIVTWFALINIFFWHEPRFITVLFPVVAFEFLVSANIGLAPIAPIGTVATLISIALHEEPYWKPAKPKRFAWYIGLTMATSCLVVFLRREELGSAYRPLIGFIAAFCNLATWLEGSAGFCIGCYIYNKWMVPMFKMEECSECKL